MSLTSWQFFVFALFVVIIYFLACKFSVQRRWMILLLSSCFFYIYSSSVIAFLILLVSAAVTWYCAILISAKGKTQSVKKTVLILCISFNICLLFFLKYCRTRVNALSWIIIPLGISYFTFQNIAYCTDVYRGSIESEQNFFKYLLFIIYFPHISQGPIDRYAELAPQFVTACNYPILYGLLRVLLGSFKKIIIANNLGRFIDVIYANPADYSGIILLFSTFLYSIQIYMDFSGYMDIVCGISECLGIKISENFNFPYFSASVSEFWRRWHITLNHFFTQFIYIPLGGSRNGALRTSINLTIIFLISGLWHGADLSFVLWGFYHGILVILEKNFLHRKSNNLTDASPNNCSGINSFFSIAKTFCLVTFGWILFRSDSVQTASLIISRIFTKFCYDGCSYGLISSSFDLFYWILLAFACLLIFAVELIDYKKGFRNWFFSSCTAVQWSIGYAFLVPLILTILLSSESGTSAGNFIYFNF